MIKPIKIFSTSHLSSLPSQAVSLIQLNIFRRLDKDLFEFWTTADTIPENPGAIKAIKTPGKSRFARYLIRFFWLWKLKPEIILFTGQPLDLLFYFFRPRKSMIIFHQNGPMAHPISSYPYRTLKYDTLWYSINFLLKRAQGIITISNYTARSLLPFKLRAPTDVVYNGVDLRSFNPKLKDGSLLKKRFNINPYKSIVINISSLIERKRPDVYLEIAKISPEYQFILIGSPQDKFGERLVAKFPEIKNLIWLPAVSRQDLPVLLAGADVFCFPSLHEGFGMVVAEAMASGCPVIASSGSGPEELVSNDCGIIISRQESPQKEIESFKSAIKSVIENPGQREKMSRNARKTAEEKFDWDELALEWKRVLEENVKGGS